MQVEPASEPSRQRGTAILDRSTTKTGDLLIGADGVDSQVREAVWPGVSHKRWTEVTVDGGVVPRDKVAASAAITRTRR